MTPLQDDSAVRGRIRRYIQATFLSRHRNFELRDDDLLLKKGVVDSMGAVQLITFLEAELGIQVPGEDITEENLGSVSAITRFVMQKTTPLRDGSVATAQG